MENGDLIILQFHFRTKCKIPEILFHMIIALISSEMSGTEPMIPGSLLYIFAPQLLKGFL